MNRTRIEELRRKLREGRPVVVVNGEVRLAEDVEREKQDKAKESKGSTDQQGVSVKPHTWGGKL